MMIEAKLPKTYWHHAVQQECHIRNMVPHSALQGETPHQLRHGQPGRLDHLHTFELPRTSRSRMSGGRNGTTKGNQLVISALAPKNMVTFSLMLTTRSRPVETSSSSQIKPSDLTTRSHISIPMVMLTNMVPTLAALVDQAAPHGAAEEDQDADAAHADDHQNDATEADVANVPPLEEEQGSTTQPNAASRQSPRAHPSTRSRLAQHISFHISHERGHGMATVHDSPANDPTTFSQAMKLPNWRDWMKSADR